MLTSIVFPMYNEDENVEPLFNRLSKLTKSVDFDIEIIAVNNGSSDQTQEKLDNIVDDTTTASASLDCKVKIISLTRNFGYDNAILTGLEHAEGDYIVIMDGDLQDPPEEIPRFVEKAEQGFEIVYGLRNKRTENFMIRIFIKIFYFWWSKVSGYGFPKNAGNFCVISNRVAKSINSLKENNKYFRGVRAWFGYSSLGLEYNRTHRSGGTSKFSFASYLIYGIEGITSFSTAPVRMLTLLGIAGIFLSFIGFVIILFHKLFLVFYPNLFSYEIAAGWTSLFLLIIILISVNLLGLGLIGEYIARIYEETKGRPRVVVDKINIKNKRKA